VRTEPGVVMADAAMDGTLNLTRAIPVPRSVSAQAQAMLVAGAAVVADRLANPQRFPAADDHAGWKARNAEVDAYIAGMFEDRVRDADVSVETIHAGDAAIYKVTPAGAASGDDAPVYYYVHGGALVAGGGDACRLMAIDTAVGTGLETWGIDYRMPPDHPYPTPLDDCVAGYRALLVHRRPERIAVGGASAGGNLAAALMLKARAERLPMPACLLLMTPEIDLTESGDTFETNAYIDVVLVNRLTESIALYANGHDLADPLLSPLFGDVSGFPPTLLQSGTRDLFLSNTVRMHRALRRANVEAELHVWEAMPHGVFFGAPEAAEFSTELRKFLARHL
jgi:epsilon-lactone hydrolase